MISPETLQKKITIIVDEIIKMPISTHFYNLPDIDQEPFYYDNVEYPICLSMIENKIKDKKYLSVKDFQNDFDLFFTSIRNGYGENSLKYTKLLQNIDLNSDFPHSVQVTQAKISQFCSDIDKLNEEEINHIIKLISSKEIPLTEFLKYFHMGYPSFKAKVISKINEFPNLKSGRKDLKIEEEEIELIQDILKFCKYGIKRLSEILEIPKSKVERICKILKTQNVVTKKKKKVHDHRFHATGVDVLWHTDLHFLMDKPPYEDKIAYLIAFIDDLTREIVYWEVLKNKKMELSTQALKNCIQKTGRKPLLMTTDNGKEFVGEDFVKELQTQGIKHHRITAGEPEENGKIEHWWPNIEVLSNYNDIGTQIDIYNKKLTNRALKKYIGQKSTPENARKILSQNEIDKENLIEFSE